jgi:predicted amidohydrolase YtcJ
MAARLASILVIVIVGATLIAGLIVGAQREDNSLPVDVIIHNAKVYEADDAGTIAEAVAIRGNKIVHVGAEREIMRYRRTHTNVIDAHGAAVLPGFDDAHVALIEGGLSHDALQLFGSASLDEVKARITAWSDAHPDATWITGGGWSYDLFVDLPTRTALDSLISDKPVRLLSQDGQALWVNSKALDVAEITKRTPDPKGGEIVHDRRGQPTGLLRGEAMALVDKLIPPPTREDRAHALEVATRDAQSRGITSVQDLGAASGDLDVYDAARTADSLGLRIYAAVPLARAPLQDFDAIGKRFPDDPVFKTGLASIAAGTPADANTLSALAALNWQLALEANDELSVRRALDALAALAKAAPAGKASRHRIEGVALVDPDDIPRFGALGVVASMQPLEPAGGLDTWTKWAGVERAPFGWAVRSLSAAGAHLAFGSGWPRLPLDPLASIRAAVNRPAIHVSEELTLKSAINGWTSGSAWASFDDHRKGTIQPGMLADLVVLTTNIFGGQAKLDAAEVAMTIFDGQIVYRRAQ